MATDGRLQAIADRLARYMLAALDGLWRFGQFVGDSWRELYPKVAAVAAMLGGWDRLGWLALAITMRGTLIQLAMGFGRLGFGAGQAAFAILSMLAPLNIVRTAALAWMATGIGAVLLGIALAGVWIWRNWRGLATFFQALWTSFREALGPVAPMLDGLLVRFAWLRDWVLAITGPVDESGEIWQRWGRLVGTSLGRVVRVIGDWVAAHPGLARALGYMIAGLGLIRLLLTPVAAGLGLFTSAAGALGTAVGVAAKALLWLRGVLLILTRALLANPIGLAVAAIAGAAYLIYRNWADVGPWFGRLWDNVKSYFLGFNEFLLGVFTLDFGRAWDGLKQMWSGATGFFQTIWDGIAGIFTAAWTNYIAPVLDKLGLLDPVKAAWQGLQDALGRVLDWIGKKFETVMAAIQPVLDALKWVNDNGAAAVNSVTGGHKAPISSGPYTGGATSPVVPSVAVPGVNVPARALGGPVRAGQTYQWQEEGRELFVPRVDGNVISNRQLRAMQAMAEAPSRIRVTQAQPAPPAGGAGAAGGRSVRLDLGGITINAAPGMDPRALARAVRREIEALTRERGFALHDGGDYA